MTSSLESKITSQLEATASFLHINVFLALFKKHLLISKEPAGIVDIQKCKLQVVIQFKKFNRNFL